MSTLNVSMTGHRIAGPDPSRLLRLALRLDATVSGASGLLILAAGSVLDTLFGLAWAVAWPFGLFMVAYATVLWVTAARPRVNRPIVWTIIIGNTFWAIASLVTMAGGWLPLTNLGSMVMVVQAGSVALFAGLQFLGLRRAGPVGG